MEFRLGTCTECSAKYKLPATFSANRAKCKKCGGVVEIGPPQGGEKAASKPAAAKAPAPKVPAKKPAPAKAAAPAAKAAAPAAKAAAKPAATAAKPAATAAKTPKPVAKAGTSSRAKAGASRTGSASRRSGASSSSRRSGSSSRSGSSRSRSSARNEKKGNGMMIGGGIGGLLVVIVAALLFMNKGDDTTQAAETQQTASLDPSGTGSADGATETPTPDAGEGAGTEGSGDESADGAGDDAAAETPDDAAAGDEGADDEADEEKMPAAKPKVVDNIDLGELPELEPFSATSPDDFAEMQQWMATYIDPDAGAAGNRSGTKLYEKGREAFPVILNAFKRQDFSTEDGYRTGDLTQKLLERICNGNNFGWRYSTEPKDIVYNKKIVQAWFRAWEQAKDNDTAWANLAKLEEVEETTPAEPELEDF